MTKVDLSELHENILNEMLTRLKKLLNAESASMFLFDSDREELVLNSVFNEHKAQFKGVRQRLGEGVAGSVAHQRQAVLVKDINTDPRFPKFRFRHYQTNSFICLPILSQDALIGVINISDKISGEAQRANHDFLNLRFTGGVSGVVQKIIQHLFQKSLIDFRLKDLPVGSKFQ